MSGPGVMLSSRPAATNSPRSWMPGIGQVLSVAGSGTAEVVGLAELPAVVAQQVVRGRHVEVEVGQRMVLEVALAGELQRLRAADGHADGLLFASIDFFGGHGLDVLDRPGDALLELADSLLGVGEGRSIDT